MKADFNVEFLEQFKDQSVALRLLRAQHFPLMTSFFYSAFIRHNRRAVPYQELIAMLDYHLSDVAEVYGEQKYPKTARAYIDDWINQKPGYLRKYLPQNSDEPECDLLPDVEKALHWVEELQGRQFVGTESRLKLLIDLIGELVQGTTNDKSLQLEALQQKKALIEQQIEAVKQGTSLGLDDTEVRERLYLVSDISRKLLGDFRQVEANFRLLDKDTRKKITLGGGQKGRVLDIVFADQDVINSSDEGKSFIAFFELLMTQQMRDSLRQNLKQIMHHQLGHEFVSSDELLQHLYSYLLEAGDKVNRTKQQITEQLRRYIEEQSQDNRRILELIRDFEAVAHQTNRPDTPLHLQQNFAEIAGIQASIYPHLSRGLFVPKTPEQLDSDIKEGAQEADVDLTNLFEVSHIDELQLQQQIFTSLDKHQGQVTLAGVLEDYPLQYGLDEVLSYIKLACEEVVPASIDTQQPQHVSWQSEPGVSRTLSVPTITFIRDTSS
ncbi:MAG TPA: DUF3375 domain-containing protein [Alteromonas sp.]|nr:DUF3375 domain-containing protein [Alteromonas sp.]|tara:strand:+ start:776 stop:2257 length:1482 start_codon:yes stop_codon:yes gene_type:complete